jgi:hypothetical protein
MQGAGTGGSRHDGGRPNAGAAVGPEAAVDLQALAIASLLRDYLVRGQAHAPAGAVLAALRRDIKQVRGAAGDG